MFAWTKQKSGGIYHKEGHVRRRPASSCSVQDFGKMPSWFHPRLLLFKVFTNSDVVTNFTQMLEIMNSKYCVIKKSLMALLKTALAELIGTAGSWSFLAEWLHLK